MTKVISISDEAYEELKKLKAGKSFSEILIEFSKKNRSNAIMKYAGILSEEEGEQIKKQIYDDRKMPSRRFK